MGWDFTKGASRRDIIEHRTRTVVSADGTIWRTLQRRLVGSVLWTVREFQKPDGTTDRYIGCDLLRAEAGYGWGYKGMEESAHPFYYSCPLSYLDMVPVECEDWRQAVREYHAGKGPRGLKVTANL